jgi:hypothetical protein
MAGNGFNSPTTPAIQPRAISASTPYATTSSTMPGGPFSLDGNANFFPKASRAYGPKMGSSVAGNNGAAFKWSGKVEKSGR